MIYKKSIFSKVLSNGLKADFCLVQDNGIFQAALYVDARHIPGPSQPTPLDTPKGDVTHWMGNRPSVGLTEDEAAKIIQAVKLENNVIKHRNDL